MKRGKKDKEGLPAFKGAVEGAWPAVFKTVVGQTRSKTYMQSLAEAMALLDESERTEKKQL